MVSRYSFFQRSVSWYRPEFPILVYFPHRQSLISHGYLHLFLIRQREINVTTVLSNRKQILGKYQNVLPTSHSTEVQCKKIILFNQIILLQLRHTGLQEQQGDNYQLRQRRQCSEHQGVRSAPRNLTFLTRFLLTQRL